MESVRFAVIGGSGLYNMPGLTNITEQRISTPFGPTSDSIMIGTLAGQRVAFLPRHGRGHVLTPGEVPYRANIYALKTLGVQYAIGISACGSLKEALEPGHVVVPDQLFDYTKNDRGRSFFGNGIVAHIGVAHPFCPELSALVADAVAESGGTVHRGGTFVTIEGPRFSTKGESQAWRQLGFAIIGMTTSPEAFLAREAEIAYATMAHVTDYDVWHASEEAVNVDIILKRFSGNIALAQRSVLRAIEKLAQAAQPCSCHSALNMAFATHKEKVTPEIVERLRPIIGKYFPG